MANDMLSGYDIGSCTEGTVGVDPLSISPVTHTYPAIPRPALAQHPPPPSPRPASRPPPSRSAPPPASRPPPRPHRPPPYVSS